MKKSLKTSLNLQTLRTLTGASHVSGGYASGPSVIHPGTTGMSRTSIISH